MMPLKNRCKGAQAIGAAFLVLLLPRPVTSAGVFQETQKTVVVLEQYEVVVHVVNWQGEYVGDIVFPPSNVESLPEGVPAVEGGQINVTLNRSGETINKKGELRFKWLAGVYLESLDNELTEAEGSGWNVEGDINFGTMHIQGPVTQDMVRRRSCTLHIAYKGKKGRYPSRPIRFKVLSRQEFVAAIAAFNLRSNPEFAKEFRVGPNQFLEKAPQAPPPPVPNGNGNNGGGEDVDESSKNPTVQPNGTGSSFGTGPVLPPEITGDQTSALSPSAPAVRSAPAGPAAERAATPSAKPADRGKTVAPEAKFDPRRLIASVGTVMPAGIRKYAAPPARKYSSSPEALVSKAEPVKTLPPSYVVPAAARRGSSPMLARPSQMSPAAARRTPTTPATPRARQIAPARTQTAPRTGTIVIRNFSSDPAFLVLRRQDGSIYRGQIEVRGRGETVIREVPAGSYFFRQYIDGGRRFQARPGDDFSRTLSAGEEVVFDIFLDARDLEE